MTTNDINISEWVEALQDQTPYFMAIIDYQGALSFTNSHFYNRFQATRISPGGQGGGTIRDGIFALIHEADRLQLTEALAACSLQENDIVVDVRIKSDMYRWIKLKISQVKKPAIMSGKFLCLGYELNVDEQQKKNMEIFQRNEQVRGGLFKSFMDHTPYFTWIVDEQENLMFANSSLLGYFGVDESAFGKKLEEIIPGPIAGLIREKHLIALNCDRQDQSIVKSKMADGKDHIYQVTVFPIRDAAAGMLTGGEALDITEAYQARQEEKKANERLLYISRAVTEAIWDRNMLSGQIYFNEALHALVGTHPGQVFDLEWFYRCIHPDDKENIERTIRMVLDRKEKSWEAEYRFQCPDGQYKTMHNRGFVLYENGEAVRMIGSLQDVSEIRNLETQLVRQKLKQQKGIAEAIIRAQEDERTRIGHELHDNINQILASCQLYLTVLDKDTGQFSEIKGKAMETLSLAIDEIRLLATAMVRPELKKGGLVVSIGDLVNDLRFDNLFEVDFHHSDTCAIEGISQHKKVALFRIAQEQVKNIIKYSHAKKIAIALDIDNDRIRLEIKDDGKGFDSGNVRRGLGLSNIYERTELYNGKVILTSAPGKGCSIVVSIPLS